MKHGEGTWRFCERQRKNQDACKSLGLDRRYPVLWRSLTSYSAWTPYFRCTRWLIEHANAQNGPSLRLYLASSLFIEYGNTVLRYPVIPYYLLPNQIHPLLLSSPLLSSPLVISHLSTLHEVHQSRRIVRLHGTMGQSFIARV